MYNKEEGSSPILNEMVEAAAEALAAVSSFEELDEAALEVRPLFNYEGEAVEFRLVITTGGPHIVATYDTETRGLFTIEGHWSSDTTRGGFYAPALGDLLDTLAEMLAPAAY